MLYILQYTCMHGTSKRLWERGIPSKPGADLASELTSDVPDSPQPAMHNTLQHDVPRSTSIGHIRATIGLIGVLPPYGDPTSGGVEVWQILSGYVREDIHATHR
jgi:hypothetical protein